MSRSRIKFTILQLFAFVFSATLIYWVFKDGRLDEWATSLFYDASNPDSLWPLERILWVEIAYRGGSMLTAVWGLAVIVGYLLGFWVESLRKLRTFCVLSFLLLALGPGLLVNAVFKDNWGRPRPRETVAFGGEKVFQAPFLVSDQGGKSFPCGHCSVGFALCIVAYWSKREQKKRFLYVGGWLAALIVGAYLGAARIAVGAHYLSDVLSSAWSVFLVAWLIDLFLPVKHVETPEALSGEEHSTKNAVNRWWMVGVGAILFVLFAGFAMMAFPIDKAGVWKLDPVVRSGSKAVHNGGEDTVKVLTIEISGEHERILWKGNNKVEWKVGQPLSFSYELKGFGLPWSTLRMEGEVIFDVETEKVTLLLSVEEQGFFKELEAVISPAVY